MAQILYTGTWTENGKQKQAAYRFKNSDRRDPAEALKWLRSKNPKLPADLKLTLVGDEKPANTMAEVMTRPASVTPAK